MKNSGVEWIGEIPEDWEVYRNKNAFVCNKEIVGKNSNNTQLLSLTTGGIKCKDINNAEGKLPESFDTYQYVKKNDVVMCLFDLDMSAVFSGISQYDGMISPAYKVLSCQDRANPLFIHYWFSYIFDGRKFNHYAKNIRYTLNYDEFATLPILLPPKFTQQRIASYLNNKCSKIEETIQNQQQVIEKLKAYKQSLITEAVTGKIKIQNGKVCGKYESYKDSKLKWLGDFKIPEVWNTIQVKSFVSIPVVDGPHESPELFDNGIPYISATAIENSKIDFSLKRGFISEKYCDECDKRYKPMRDDILMIKLGATTGQVAIIDTDERFNIWVPLAAIRCNKTIALPKFVFYSFQSDYCLKQMEMSWTFGTQQTLGVSSIERLKIFLPNIETQKNITHFLDKKCTAIDTAIEQKQKLIEKLTEYKKSLIYECVTGKKEI